MNDAGSGSVALEITAVVNGTCAGCRVMLLRKGKVPIVTAEALTARVGGVDALLAAARGGVHRPDPHEMLAAQARGALVIDTRTETQRAEQGELPGALVIDRTILEWRLDPDSDYRIPEAVDHDIEVIVVCSQGYSSSLAAASLRALGLWRATDLAGGFESYVAAGLPFSDQPADVRR